MKRILVAAVAALALGACGRGGTPSAVPGTTAASATKGELVAQVASYDLAANRDQRVIIGLQTSARTPGW